jgi:hypothetical protein
MKKSLLLLAVPVFAVIGAGCSASFTTNTTSNATSNASKPANTASNSSTSNTNSAKKEKAKLADEKKPEGKSNKAKNNPVPDSWVYVYDESKGYGFSVPEGTTGESQTVSGIDVFTATTPDGIDIFVLAYKDKTLSKDDLLDDAVKFLEGMGQTVKPGELKGESDDYYVADADTEYKSEGRKGKLRILVGTDVTDNYIMIVGTDAAKFAANEKTIDEIWGSFEMWSGGASGN